MQKTKDKHIFYTMDKSTEAASTKPTALQFALHIREKIKNTYTEIAGYKHRQKY